MNTHRLLLSLVFLVFSAGCLVPVFLLAKKRDVWGSITTKDDCDNAGTLKKIGDTCGVWSAAVSPGDKGTCYKGTVTSIGPGGKTIKCNKYTDWLMLILLVCGALFALLFLVFFFYGLFSAPGKKGKKGKKKR